MGSLFGNTTTTRPTSSSFFGNPATGAGASTGPSLFGNPAPAQQTQQQQQQPNTSLLQPPVSSASAGESKYGEFNAAASMASFPPGLSVREQQDLARSRLAQAGMSSTLRNDEPSIHAQAQTLLRKWDPHSQDSLLQTYLYNAVSVAYAPFYQRQPYEKEAEWEKALAEAPKLDGVEGMKMVPVLVRGFQDLDTRLATQSVTLNKMYERLHEMNNSLTAVMQTHQQRIALALAATSRQHTVLAQRTLRLATKLQILRNRGYALDAAEENLRKQLISLSASVNDPAFAAREEDIWARMVALRERGRWLEEEGKRVGAEVEKQSKENGDGAGGVPEHVLEKARKILKDYEGQLRHLGKEFEEVKSEFVKWEAEQKPRR